jgi:endogenous inhibitor of DNA gyrase (YacG/DUF329 family)
MIKISEIVRTRESQVKCPSCDKVVVYTTYIQAYCPHCKARCFPNLMLLEDEDKRIEYHRSGKIAYMAFSVGGV